MNSFLFMASLLINLKKERVRGYPTNNIEKKSETNSRSLL